MLSGPALAQPDSAQAATLDASWLSAGQFKGSREPTSDERPTGQGYGRFLTDAEGRYYFRTIKPVSYTLGGQFRAPHIHVAVSKAGRRIMATQAMVKGHPDNEGDLIVERIGDPALLETIMVEYRPLRGSTLGELTAEFDIVLGRTARELEDGSLGGIGPPG